MNYFVIASTGPDRVLCTNDFVSALGLENNEMQDPNEVSRDIKSCWHRHLALLFRKVSSIYLATTCG